MLLLAMLLAATACKREKPEYLNPDEEIDTEATGYLSFSPVGLYVVVDADTDQNTESPTPIAMTRANDPGVPSGNDVTADRNDLGNFWVKIERMADGLPVESVYHGTYAALGSDRKEVKVGTYRVMATSNEACAAPTAVQSKPYYEASTDDLKVLKNETTEIGTLTCTLQNIKVSVEVAADLYSLLDPLNDQQLIDAAVYYGNDRATAPASLKWTVPAAWDWTQKDPTPVYFPALADDTTLNFYFQAKLKSTGVVITMNKEITDLLPGQWRRIRVIPKYDTQGNITFTVEISTFVQDETIVVGDTNDANVSKKWKELAYDDPDAPTQAIPALRWADGTELPETIEVGTTQPQPVVLSVPGGVAKLGLKFEASNPWFSDDVAAMNIEDLCALDRNNATLNHYGIPYGETLTGATEITLPLGSILNDFAEHEGVYTFTFAVTDAANANVTYELPLSFTVGAGASGTMPTITWANGTLFDESGMDENGKPKPGAEFVTLSEGMQVAVELEALPHFNAIKAKIVSELLSPGELASVGLPAEFDLCHLVDAKYEDIEMSAEDQADTFVNFLHIVDKVNDDLKAESRVTFDISGFVSILMNFSGAQFQFQLTIENSVGLSKTAYLRLQAPEE